MLLPLPGSCAVVGPFHGREWEPVRDLLSQDYRCRDPQCCGNLLVLCLFLIWQARHSWYKVTRTCSSKRHANKVPMQKWVVPSMKNAASFRPSPEFSSPGKFRNLDSHFQQWAQKRRGSGPRRLQESWAQYLFCPQHLCQGPSWGVHIPSETIFCTSSFSSSCLFSQDSSWEVQGPCCLREGQVHPSLHVCQRMEQLLAHSQEVWVPKERVIGRGPCSSLMTFGISVPHLPSAQRVQFCSSKLPGPANQQQGTPTLKAWGSSLEVTTPWEESHTAGCDYRKETQTQGWVSQRESRGEDAWEMQASGAQLSAVFGMEDGSEAKVLGCRNPRQVTSETEGEMAKTENQTEAEKRAQIGELRKKSQGEAESPPEIQAYMGESQEQLSYNTDTEPQTPEWGHKEKGGWEGALETHRGDSDDEEEARGEEEGGIQAQGPEKQGQLEGKSGEEAQCPQTHVRGDIGARTEAEEGRHKEQVGGEGAVPTQTSGGQNLEEVKQEGSMETQALGLGKRECPGSREVRGIPTLVNKRQGQAGSEKARYTPAARGGEQEPPECALQEGWEKQGLGRGENTGEPQICSKKQLREVREEDWVVIQALWQGNQRLVVSGLDREFKLPCWGNVNQIGGEHRADIWATGQNYQRESGEKGGTNVLVPEAEDQGKFGGDTDVDTHPAGAENGKWCGNENGTDIQELGKRNPRGVKGQGGTAAQELREENQGQRVSEFHGEIHIPKSKNQEHSRGEDGTRIWTFAVAPWGGLTGTTGEISLAGCKKGERDRGGDAEETRQGVRNVNAEVEAGPRMEAAGEGRQRLSQEDTHRKSCAAQWENRKQMRSEDGRDAEAPEGRNQGGYGADGGLRTQRPERENQGQLYSNTGGSCALGRGSWGHPGGRSMAASRVSERRCRSHGRRIRRLSRKKQRLSGSKVDGKICSSEGKNQGQTGRVNGAESQIPGKRSLRSTTGGHGMEMAQAPAGDGWGQPGRETGTEVPTQRKRNQNRGGGEGAAGMWRAESQRERRPEHARWRGVEGPLRGKEATRTSLQGDCSGGEGLTGRKHSLPQPLTGFGCLALEQKQEEAGKDVASVPCSERRPHPQGSEGPLLASGKGEHLASPGTAPAWEHRAGIGPASQRAPSRSWGRGEREKGVNPGKAFSLTQQPQSPQAVAALWGAPSACPFLPYSQVPQAASDLASVPTALTVTPEWPVLKKSKRLLLEALMRRRIAHLRWGLPRRVLESYLLFNLLGSCSLPQAGLRLPGVCAGQELQTQQAKHGEARASTAGKSQIIPPSERKSPKLVTEAGALQTCRPPKSEPTGRSVPPQKPKRNRPPGGAREPHIQEAWLGAELPAPRDPRPAAESGRWCGTESEQRPSSENRRAGKMIRPGPYQMAETAPSTMKASLSRAGHNHIQQEYTSWEASEAPRLKCQQPTHWGRGHLASAEGRGAKWQPSSCSTDTSSFGGSLHSAVARLGMAFLSKVSWSSQVAKLQHSAPNLSLRDLPLLSQAGDPHAGEDCVGVGTALERDLQRPEHCYARSVLPRTESPQGQEIPGNPNEVPLHSLPARQKFAFMKQLKCFLFWGGIKK